MKSCENIAFNVSLDLLGGTPTSMSFFLFFCLPVHPSICLFGYLSVVHHISGTLHHVIIIFGTHV